MNLLNKLSDLVGKYLTLIVVVVTAAAFVVPSAFVWASSRTTLLLSCVMFGMGMTLNFADFKTAFGKPKQVLIGCLLQFTIMPLLAFALAKAFLLPTALAVGVVLVGTCPGGTASNVMTYLAKGDVAFSVTMTMVSTLAAPLLTPFLTWMLAGQWVEVSMLSMCTSVVKVVLVPVTLGLVAHKLFNRYLAGVSKAMVLVSAFCVLSIMGSMIASNKAQILANGVVLVVVLALHNLGGYCMGYLAARKMGLDMRRAATVSIEVGMQNAALACSLSNAHFSALSGVPGAVAGVIHQVTGSMLASIFSKMQEKEQTTHRQTEFGIRNAEFGMQAPNGQG